MLLLSKFWRTDASLKWSGIDLALWDVPLFTEE